MRNTIREKIIDFMITDIIRKYGFEHPSTIAFCKIAECHSLKVIKACYKRIMGQEVV